MRSAIRLFDEERSRINIATKVSVRTIEYYAAGYSISRTNLQRIEEALAKLGIKRKEREVTPGSGRRRRTVGRAA